MNKVLTAEELEFIEKSKNWKRYKVLRQLPDNGTSHAIIVGNCYYSGTFYDSEYNINDLIEEGYIILYEEPFPFQKDLVGKNKRTVYCYCPQCKSFGVNTPLEMTCGNCGYTKTVTYYDAETINDYLEAYKNQSSVSDEEDLVASVQKDSIVPCDAPVDSSNSIETFEDGPYCSECGSTYLSYIDQYACGRHYKCNDCGREICYSEEAEAHPTLLNKQQNDNRSVATKINSSDDAGIKTILTNKSIKMKWIKTSERLPEKEGDYFIIDGEGNKRIMYSSGVTHHSRWRAIVHAWLDEESNVSSQEASKEIGEPLVQNKSNQ